VGWVVVVAVVTAEVGWVVVVVMEEVGWVVAEVGMLLRL
jgi:hypothetical protein